MSLRRSHGILLLAALVSAACGSSGVGSPQPTSGPAAASSTAGPAVGAATLAPAPSDGGAGASEGSGSNGIPPIDISQFNLGRAHVEITGDMTTTVDAGIASGTDSVLGYLDDQTGYSVQIGLSNRTGSGIAISGKNLQVSGAWGKECQVKITLNDGTSLAGEFTCPTIQGAGAAGAKPLNLALTGTFTAK